MIKCPLLETEIRSLRLTESPNYFMDWGLVWKVIDEVKVSSPQKKAAK